MDCEPVVTSFVALLFCHSLKAENHWFLSKKNFHKIIVVRQRNKMKITFREVVEHGKERSKSHKIH